MGCENRVLHQVFAESSVGDNEFRNQVGKNALSAFTTEKPEDGEPMTISELGDVKKEIARITKLMPVGSGRNHLSQRIIPELRAINKLGAAPAPIVRRLMRAKDAFDSENAKARKHLGMVPGTEAFQGKDLIGLSFRQSNLAGGNFRGTFFSQCSMQDVNLNRARISWKATNSDFSRASMVRSDVTHMDCDNCTLDRVVLDKSVIRGVRLKNCSASKLKLRNARVDRLSLENVTLTKSVFDGSRINELFGEDNSFDGSSWKNVHASRWRIWYSDFLDATFDGTTFDTGLLTDNNFSRATFRGKPNALTIRSLVWNSSNFQKASLSEITAEASQFVDTNFTDATLERCSFRPKSDDPTARCDFTQARFNAAKIRATNFGTCNLREATFDEATLGAGTHFGGATLGGATFRNAVIEADVDFADAIFDQTDFTGATIARGVVFTDAQRNAMIGYDTITFVD